MPLALILPRGDQWYLLRKPLIRRVCVCVFSSHLFWTSGLLNVPAGVTQGEGPTCFLFRLPSAVLALIFLARRIQPFLSLVDREVGFCVLTIKSFSTCWAFYFYFCFDVWKNPSYRDSNSRPNVSDCFEVTNWVCAFPLLIDIISRKLMSKSSPWSQGRKTPPGRGKRTSNSL